MTSRCTKTDREQRVLRIVSLIANGAANSEIREFVRREWGLSRSQADRYIALARETIIEDIDRDRREVTAELMATCKSIIKQSIRDKQFNNALGGANLLAKLGGLIER